MWLCFCLYLEVWLCFAIVLWCFCGCVSVIFFFEVGFVVRNIIKKELFISFPWESVVEKCGKRK